MFFTLEDPNAKIKGSRDPLGVQPIWTSFARHVVTNLTSVTGSLRGFTILLLGRYIVSRLVEAGRLPQEAALEGFLRFEQIAAHVRHAAHSVEADIRGIERVKRAHLEGKGRVTIAADRHGYILSDQKVYGLWGLFSVSARVSGLIPEGPIGVAAPTKAFIEGEYGPLLEPIWNGLERLVERGGKLGTGPTDAICAALGAVLRPTVSPNEQAFYGEHLRDGIHVKGRAPQRQARFRNLLQAHGDLEARTGRAEILTIAEAAAHDDPGLERALHRIADLEAVVAPSTTLFDFMLTCHGQPIAERAKALRDRWGESIPNISPAGIRELLDEISKASSADHARLFDDSAHALATGDFEAAMRAAMDWNAKVMAGRQGAPWVRLETGCLDVRYRGAERLLPAVDDLPTLWGNSYFVDSLKQITSQLEQVETR